MDIHVLFPALADKFEVITFRTEHRPAERVDKETMETAGIIDAQHKGGEPLVFGIPEFRDNAALQLAELVRAVLVVLFEFRRILLENHLEGRVTPSGFCRAGGIIGIKVLDVLADGDERATVTTHGTVPWINRDMVVLLSQMRRQLRRADTTAGRKAENAGAVPQAAAQ